MWKALNGLVLEGFLDQEPAVYSLGLHLQTAVAGGELCFFLQLLQRLPQMVIMGVVLVSAPPTPGYVV